MTIEEIYQALSEKQLADIMPIAPTEAQATLAPNGDFEKLREYNCKANCSDTVQKRIDVAVWQAKLVVLEQFIFAGVIGSEGENE